MKYRALVVPAIGKPIKSGGAVPVLMAATKFLDAHPAYTIAIRSYERDLEESPHSILLWRDAGGWRYAARPGDGLRPRPTRMARDVAEILSVLTNLGIEPTTGEP